MNTATPAPTSSNWLMIIALTLILSGVAISEWASLCRLFFIQQQ